MRSKLFILSSILFAACGGGGDSKPDAKIFLDAAKTVDAAATCAIACELKPPVTTVDLCEGTNYKSISYGSDASPAEFNYFLTFGADAGPLANRTAFSVGLIVSESDTNADILFIRLLKPVAGGFPLNTAVNFDTDPNSATPAAWSFMLGNAARNGTTGAIDSVEQEYWASAGSITVSSIAEADASIIKGNTSPIVWSEIDMNGAPVTGGCSINMGMTGAASGFGFTLKQKAAAFQPTSAPQYINGMRVMTPDELKAVENYIAKRHPNLAF